MHAHAILHATPQRNGKACTRKGCIPPVHTLRTWGWGTLQLTKCTFTNTAAMEQWKPHTSPTSIDLFCMLRFSIGTRVWCVFVVRIRSFPCRLALASLAVLLARHLCDSYLILHSRFSTQTLFHLQRERVCVCVHCPRRMGSTHGRLKPTDVETHSRDTPVSTVTIYKHLKRFKQFF